MVNIIKVFKPEPGSGSVDKSKPFDLNNMIPCKHDSPALIPKQLALYDDHQVVFVITRSKNDNTVVYGARTHQHRLDEHEPIEVYWMGFSRKDPHEVDPSKLRDDLNWIEKKVAYGASAHKLHGSSDEFEVKLVAVPHLKVTMKMHGDRPRLTGMIGGHQCYVTRVYVLAQENMIGLPKVIFVNIHGIDMETGEEIVEKISP
jgi:hypothetical protein